MRFKKIYLEILNSCNLSCPFCIQNSRKPESLTVEKFQYLIQQVKPYTNYLYFHVLGEPLMHPHLASFFEIAYQHDIQVNLTTNGTLLTQRIDDLLQASSLRQVNVSLHSFPKQEDYLNQVLSCAKRLSEKGIYVSLRLWTFNEFEISADMKHTLNVLEETFDTHFSTFNGSHRLAERLFLSFDETFEWPKLNLPFVSTEGKCQGWINQCGILVDGTVVPCCLDAAGVEKLGNIYEEDFETIVNRHQKLVERMRQHHMDLPLCQHCSYRTRFK